MTVILAAAPPVESVINRAFRIELDESLIAVFMMSMIEWFSLACYGRTMSPGSIREILFLETRLELAPNGVDEGVRRTLRVLPVLSSAANLDKLAAKNFDTSAPPIRNRFSDRYGAALPQKVQSHQGTHGNAF